LLCAFVGRERASDAECDRECRILEILRPIANGPFEFCNTIADSERQPHLNRVADLR
jgi:hypothetical protein